MYLFLILNSILNIFFIAVAKIEQMSIAKYFSYSVVILIITMLLEFIIGILLFKFEIENNLAWLLFTGFGFEYDVEDLKEYVVLNLPRVIIGVVTLLTFYLMLGKVV